MPAALGRRGQLRLRLAGAADEHEPASRDAASRTRANASISRWRFLCGWLVATESTYEPVAPTALAQRARLVVRERDRRTSGAEVHDVGQRAGSTP